jgi:SNF2 family DNA or RNA helicase
MDNVQSQVHEYNLNGAKILLAKSMNKPLTFSEKAILNSYLLKARRAVKDGRLVGGKNPGERVKKVVEIINEITKEGKKIVVYSEWIDTLKLIKEELRDTEYVEFTGNVPNKLRAKNLGRFILEDNVKVFLSTDSGGLGVDGLQLASHHVIHMEDLWNPMKMEQRNGRLVRMLQSSDVVYVHRFTSESGVEEMLTNANNRKYGIIEDMFGISKGN